MAAENATADAISRLRAAADRVRQAREFSEDVINEFQALGIMDLIADTGDPVFETGQHEGLTKGDVSNGLFAVQQFIAYFDTHKTNLQAVRN